MLLHNSHTDNTKARENLPVAANCFHATKKLLTGPHTFIASSFNPDSKFQSNLRLINLPRQKSNAIKASVPKLFNCPGAISFFSSSPLRKLAADQRGRFRPLDELTTPWDRSRSSCKSPQTQKGFRPSAPRPARSLLSSRAVQKHTTLTP